MNNLIDRNQGYEKYLKKMNKFKSIRSELTDRLALYRQNEYQSKLKSRNVLVQDEPLTLFFNNPLLIYSKGVETMKKKIVLSLDEQKAIEQKSKLYLRGCNFYNVEKEIQTLVSLLKQPRQTIFHPKNEDIKQRSKLYTLSTDRSQAISCHSDLLQIINNQQKKKHRIENQYQSLNDLQNNSIYSFTSVIHQQHKTQLPHLAIINNFENSIYSRKNKFQNTIYSKKQNQATQQNLRLRSIP